MHWSHSAAKKKKLKGPTCDPLALHLARANYVENGSRSEQRPSALSAR